MAGARCVSALAVSGQTVVAARICVCVIYHSTPLPVEELHDEVYLGSGQGNKHVSLSVFF